MGLLFLWKFPAGRWNRATYPLEAPTKKKGFIWTAYLLLSTFGIDFKTLNIGQSIIYLLLKGNL